MLPTLDQTAQDHAEQRRETGKKLFEAAYTKLLPAVERKWVGMNQVYSSEMLPVVKDSSTLYKVILNQKGELEIVFSSPGLSKVILPLLADGKVGRAATRAPLEPEALSTLLAEHIVSQKEAFDKAEQLDESLRKSYRGLSVVSGLVGIGFLIAPFLKKSDYASAGHSLPLVLGAALLLLLLGAAMYFVYKLVVVGKECRKLLPILPPWFRFR
jgi:hypothetical protein